ncbi:hypothetical protein [Leucobacter sp. cx-169]|uniref:hypothetical protein n=1 Tax=Leucobacter sp. cx-169 TaxID=2770549 RepID=UPI00165DC55D|nr:hypothetical protein [Leucobacter sp. cx-169]MBC9927325.1 hypothetical protein [Leucobacter sp. cx-169]
MSDESLRLPPRKRRVSGSALINNHVVPTDLTPLTPSSVQAEPTTPPPAADSPVLPAVKLPVDAVEPIVEAPAPPVAPFRQAASAPAPIAPAPAPAAEPSSIIEPAPLPYAPGGTKRTFYLSNEVQYLLTNAQIALLDTGLYARESHFVEAAIREKVEREQNRYNGGQPFPKSPFQQRATGRPPKNEV